MAAYLKNCVEYNLHTMGSLKNEAGKEQNNNVLDLCAQYHVKSTKLAGLIKEQASDFWLHLSNGGVRPADGAWDTDHSEEYYGYRLNNMDKHNATRYVYEVLSGVGTFGADHKGGAFKVNDLMSTDELAKFVIEASKYDDHKTKAAVTILIGACKNITKPGTPKETITPGYNLKNKVPTSLANELIKLGF